MSRPFSANARLALAVGLIAGLAGAAGGCGSVLGSAAAPGEPNPEPAETSTPADSSSADVNGDSTAADKDDELTLLLTEGEAALARGETSLAVGAFQDYLAFGERDERAARALWGLSVALLQPDTDVQDPARAYRLLAALSERHPDTVEGLQASWLHGLLLELERSQAVAAEQAQVIGRLNEMVEQLRQIDLNRRPGGGPPDSLSRRPRPER